MIIAKVPPPDSGIPIALLVAGVIGGLVVLVGLILLMVYCVRRSHESDSKYTPLLERNQAGSSSQHVIGSPYEFTHVHGGGKVVDGQMGLCSLHFFDVVLQATSNLVKIEDAQKLHGGGASPAPESKVNSFLFLWVFFC